MPPPGRSVMVGKSQDASGPASNLSCVGFAPAGPEPDVGAATTTSAINGTISLRSVVGTGLGAPSEGSCLPGFDLRHRIPIPQMTDIPPAPGLER